ncbi:hypothetical protein OAT16_07540 [Prolixibacteraceae bacterium]|nr:hypothetical protein [Prolixibacteraceae bacterium]
MEQSDNPRSTIGHLVKNSCYIPIDQLDFLKDQKKHYMFKWLQSNTDPLIQPSDDIELKYIA